jgi:hypothetical protein
MNISAREHSLSSETEPMRILGRGLRAQRGVRLTMRALREAAARTQLDVATASQMDQADVSRLEGRSHFEDCQVSTLRRYITALGGTLELVATFGNKKIALCGVESGAPEVATDNNALHQTKRARSGRRATSAAGR